MEYHGSIAPPGKAQRHPFLDTLFSRVWLINMDRRGCLETTFRWVTHRCVRLEGLQRLPPDENPIVVALNSIGTVHFARFVFLGEDSLAVITTYDGSFDSYIDSFVEAIGGVFNQLLAHMEDAPPLPVTEHRDEFLAYVKDRDLTCIPPFYSCYPQLSTQRILGLQRNASEMIAQRTLSQEWLQEYRIGAARPPFPAGAGFTKTPRPKAMIMVA
jgi:hypothetical protein